MNVEMLRGSGWIIFEGLVGSRAYGTYTEESDYDYRGVFITPTDNTVTLRQIPMEVGQLEPQDVKFYDLKKYMTLALDANPNILEYLWLPQDCVVATTSAWAKLVCNRDLFISKKAHYTHSGYAFAQIKKATGQNKLINNPQPEEPPKREDFCWIIGRGSFDGGRPSRPVPYRDALNDDGYPLELCKAAKLEHVKDTYRLYYYGTEANGVFRNGNLVCESIPLEDEVEHFAGLLIYNEQEYEKAKLAWDNYWHWVRTRNNARWRDQENNVTDADMKNMQHCFRLIYSGINILRNGEPLVRFDGERLQFLRDIRAGKYKHEWLMAKVEEEMASMKDVFAASSLPHSANLNRIDELYRELCEVKGESN
jgi:predicted nucleotidyltransferase